MRARAQQLAEKNPGRDYDKKIWELGRLLPYHFLYSLFWDNKIDWVVVSTSGTRKDLWETYDRPFRRWAISS